MLVAVGYFVAAELGHALSFHAFPFATFWPAAGVLLAALVLSPRSWWPLIVLWAMAANYLSDIVVHGKSSYLSMFFLLANATESVTAALLIRLVLRGRTRVNSLRSMPTIILAGVLCPMLGAAIGASGLVLVNDANSFFHNWRVWWVADVIGMLVVAPIVLIWAKPTERHVLTPSHWRVGEACLLTALLMGLAEYVFHGRFFLFFVDQELRMRFPIVLLPLLAWIALRFELRGATLANGIIALFAVFFTTRGVGPFAEATNDVIGRAILLQGFLGVTTFITLTLGAGFSEHRRSEQRQRRLVAKLATERAAQREQTELLQAILNSMDDGVVVVDKNLKLLQLNPAAQRMHGNAHDDSSPVEWPRNFGIFHRDGQTHLSHEHLPLVRVIRGDSPVVKCEAMLRHAECPEGILINAIASPVRDRQGELVAGVVIMRDITERARADEDKQRLIGELQQALREIKTLRGLIPICASCKSVRDESGYWQKLEAFLTQHADVEFSHGICNDCGEKLYGELWKQAQLDNKVA